MKEILASIMLTVAVCVCAFAGEDHATETASRLRDQAMAGTGAFELLQELTTRAGPRLPGTAGDRIAVAWAVERLKQLGYDKVWTEPFEMQGWERISETGSILLSDSSQAVRLTALGWSVATPPGGLSADIAHFGSYAELEAAEVAAVSGKIVFISERLERRRDGSAYRVTGVGRTRGPDLASRKGAAAIIIRSVGTDDHRNPHTGATSYDEGTTPIPAAALSNPDADQLLRLMELGAKPRFHLDLQTRHTGTVTTHNVIGEITGSVTPQDSVLMGCHLDSWDLGTGAVDDGAGCAIVMQAGALIGQLDVAPARSVRVVLFGAEEQGLIGARAYVAAYADEIGVSQLIGSESDFGAGDVYGLQATVPDEALPMVDAMAQVLVPIGIARMPGRTRGGSDMSALTGHGMWAIGLMQDGSDYFDLHHTPDDTLDKVKPGDLAQNVAAYAVYGYIAASWPGELRYKTGQ